MRPGLPRRENGPEAAPERRNPVHPIGPGAARSECLAPRGECDKLPHRDVLVRRQIRGMPLMLCSRCLGGPAAALPSAPASGAGVVSAPILRLAIACQALAWARELLAGPRSPAAPQPSCPGQSERCRLPSL